MERNREIKKICFAAVLLFFAFALVRPLTGYAMPDMQTVNALREEDVRIYDEAMLLTEAEQEALAEAVSSLRSETGHDAVIVTADSLSGFTDEADYADYFYVEGGFGTGDEHSGSLCLIALNEGIVYIYTKGETTRYLTDSALDRIIEHMIEACGAGDFAAAFAAYTEGADYFCRQGVFSGQYNYDSVTGETDYAGPGYAETKKRTLKPWELLTAFIVSLPIGLLPCRSVKKKYAMENEKVLAQGFKLAYRAEAAFQFKETGGEAKLLQKYVTTLPLPRVHTRTRGGGGGRFGGGSIGGGRSTMVGGRGGMHGGRSGRF